jgi:hypothetical protein
MANNWQNPDVHAHTNEMREVINELYKTLPTQTQHRLSEFDRATIEILKHYEGDIHIINTIQKMIARKDVLDSQLSNVSPAGLLSIVWFDIIKPTSEFDHFRDTLNDMGGTCVQGDSHRLFATYVAFTSDYCVKNIRIINKK